MAKHALSIGINNDPCTGMTTGRFTSAFTAYAEEIFGDAAAQRKIFA